MSDIIDQCKSIAQDIYSELGSGFDEPIYQKSFEVALRLNNIPYDNFTVNTGSVEFNQMWVDRYDQLQYLLEIDW